MSAGEFDYVEGVTEEGIAVKVRINGRYWQFCGSWIWCPFYPWIRDLGWVKNQESGSGMNNLDHISESLEVIFGIKYFNSLMRVRIRDPGILLTLDPGPGMEKIRIRDKLPKAFNSPHFDSSPGFHELVNNDRF
jgi:hypothetical protein